MKRSFIMTSILVVVILISSFIFASEDNSLKLIIKGSAREFEPAPMIVHDRTMIPIRFVSESLGFDVGWNGITREVTLTKDDKTIVLTIDSDKARVGGLEETITLDSPPFIKENRTFVPLRFVSETIGEVVKWDGANKTVIIGDYCEKVDDNKKLILYISEKFGFSLAIPEEVYNNLAIIEKEKAVYFYVKSIYDKSNNGVDGFTGRLFSIGQYDNPINLYHGGAAINLLYNDTYYNALFASDVNFPTSAQEEYNEMWRNSMAFLHTFRLLDKESSTNKATMIEGKVAMLTEDDVLINPYMITVDVAGKVVRKNIINEIGYVIEKNDMVIVIEEGEETCRVVQAFGDIPRLRGTVKKANLTYDRASFINTSNQIVLNNAMGYDGVNGNEKGLQNAVATVVERRGDWLRMAMPAGASDLWFKAESLSYDFAKIVFDLKE